jgi:NADPH:quinone reductase-like Zn-dependent oxidoreductase
MAASSLPSTMRIWKYDSTDGGLEEHLKLYSSEPLPKPSPSQHLIKVVAVALNPVDYKAPEAPLIGRFAVKKPATPCFDVAGHIVTPADGSPLEPGQLVFGTSNSNPLGGGALAEYVAAPANAIFRVPSGISPLTAAGIPVAATTAFASLIPYISKGSRVFINGGSGGVGTYAVQIAKAAEAHVTVSCSARNVELCRSLGADDVLDYNARPLLDQLRDMAAAGHAFDLVVDNVFSDPALYFQAHTYTTPNAKFVEVASAPSLAFLQFALGAFLWPAFLGGGRRKLVFAAADIRPETLERIGEWIAGGVVKPVTDGVFSMEDVVNAFKRLKSGRATGKIIIDVSGVKG